MSTWTNDTEGQIVKEGTIYQYDYADKDNPNFDLSFSKAGKPFLRAKLGVWTGNDTPKDYYTLVVFDQQAEAVAECLQPGDRIVVVGAYKSKTFDKRDGTQGIEKSILASDVAVSLKWSRVRVLRSEATTPKPSVTEKAAELGGSVLMARHCLPASREKPRRCLRSLTLATVSERVAVVEDRPARAGGAWPAKRAARQHRRPLRAATDIVDRERWCEAAAMRVGGID